MKRYVFNHLKKTGIKHAITTRYSGYSLYHYRSLNLGTNTGDDNNTILKNRNVVCDYFSVNPNRLFLAKQMHGAHAICIDDQRADTIASTEADALITNRNDILIGVLIADCFPLLVADTFGTLCAAVHAGRKGIESGIIQNTLSIITRDKNVPVEHLKVGVGPGISKTAYTVDRKTAQSFLNRTSAFNSEPPIQKNKVELDLRSIIHKILTSSGVKDDNIEHIDLCTCSNSDLFFSYRRNNGVTGRFGAFITLA
jgi:polyphenol oxidase